MAILSLAQANLIIGSAISAARAAGMKPMAVVVMPLISHGC